MSSIWKKTVKLVGLVSAKIAPLALDIPLHDLQGSVFRKQSEFTWLSFVSHSLMFWVSQQCGDTS